MLYWSMCYEMILDEGMPRNAKPIRLPKFPLQDGPLFSVGAKGAESGDKRRQIRRPFHSECTDSPF